MSRTKIKNAKRVWEAICDMTAGQSRDFHHYFSVRRVSERAGLSKPTVKRYLEMAVSEGAARSWEDENGKTYYRISEDYD